MWRELQRLAQEMSQLAFIAGRETQLGQWLLDKSAEFKTESDNQKPKGS